MLQTLKYFSPTDSAGFLSDVITSFLPDPGLVPQESLVKDEDKGLILAEIREMLGLSEGDTSPAARSKILDCLTEELAQLELREADLNNLRDHLDEIKFNEF